jgi:hypothetical protein
MTLRQLRLREVLRRANGRDPRGRAGHATPDWPLPIVAHLSERFPAVIDDHTVGSRPPGDAHIVYRLGQHSAPGSV